jgi:hypothetical protein
VISRAFSVAEPLARELLHDGGSQTVRFARAQRGISVMWKAILSFALATALAATPAVAGTLATSAVFTGDGDDVVCMLSNVSGAPLEDVSVEVRDGTGLVAAATLSSTDCASPLAAGASCFVNKTLSGAQRVRCEFSFQGLPKRARANMTVDDGTRVIALPAD